MSENERYRGWQFNNHSNRFDKNATIILVGSRGVGKSTLAVLTAMALNRRFIDMIVTMETLCGESCETIRTKYGHEAFCQKESEILSSILAKYPTNCVIATTSSSVEQPVQSVLLRYKEQLPIINILRSPEDVSECLQRYDDYEELIRLAKKRQDLYRLCSDFEFTNNGTRFQGSNSCPLGLKNMEREFLDFLDRIYSPSLNHPTAYSHDLVLPYHDITEIDLENVAIGTNTVHIRVDLMALWAISRNVDILLHVSTQVGFLKRVKRRLPIVYGLGRFVNPDIQQLYPLLISHGFKLAVEFVSLCGELLEESAAVRQLVTTRRSTNVIGCYSTNTWDAAKVESIVRRGIELGCDIAKVNSFALELNDNYLLTNAVQNLKRRGNIDMSKLIAYNNGPLGKFSRCLNPLLTPVSHPSFWHDRNSFFAPDFESSDPEFQGPDGIHLTVKEANQLLKNLYINPQADVFCFGGEENENHWRDTLQSSIDLMSLPCYFHEQPIRDRHNIREALSSPHFGGAFISERLKTGGILDEVPSCSDDCKMIGAANLVVASRDPNSLRVNALTAHNTDWLGLYSTISHKLPTKNSIGGSTSALVIGANGLARAAIFALIQIGARNIFIHKGDEDDASAQRVISHFNVTADKLSTFGPQASNIDQASHTILSMRYITRKGDLREPDQHRPKNYGTISFEKDARIPVFNRLERLDCEWADRVAPPPTIVINCSSGGSDFTLHPSLFGNTSGGVAVDIGTTCRSKLREQLAGLPKEGPSGWVILDGTEVWIEIADSNLELLTGKRSSMAALRESVQKVYNRGINL